LGIGTDLISSTYSLLAYGPIAITRMTRYWVSVALSNGNLGVSTT